MSNNNIYLLQGKSSYKIGEKQFRGDSFSWFGQKRIYFRGRTNLVPWHFAFTSGVRQNMKAKYPGNEDGGRNCKTAKINWKFVDIGITTLFLPLGTCATLDTNSIPGGYTIGFGREYGEWHPPVLRGKYEINFRNLVEFTSLSLKVNCESFFTLLNVFKHLWLLLLE